MTRRAANLLKEGASMHQLPPELLTIIFDFIVDQEHPDQIPLTHVCRYWRTVILSYPRIWSTVCMRPGDPSTISEWLVRSQKVPLTIIAKFTDTYEHPPCRYQDSATTTLAGTNNLEVCPRHKAVLSLDKLLPHHSRIRTLNILFDSSDPDWDDDGHDGEPTLLFHHFFKETLPNLQHLDFRAIHIKQDRYMIPIPDSLFAKKLPRLKQLECLGVTDGLMGTAKSLTSCEIGSWSESAGPTIIDAEVLRVLSDNNKTLKSLTINECKFATEDSWAPIATPMTNIEFLRIYCPVGNELQNYIHTPQFKNLDTVHLSLSFFSIQAVATGRSGHKFEFSQFTGNNSNFHPLKHLGADVITLRLDRGMTLNRPDDGPALYEKWVV